MLPPEQLLSEESAGNVLRCHGVLMLFSAQQVSDSHHEAVDPDSGSGCTRLLSGAAAKLFPERPAEQLALA